MMTSTEWEEFRRRATVQLARAQACRKANRRKSPATRSIWTLDCETDPFEKEVIPHPFIWGLYDGEADDYHEFSDADEVAKFISDKEILIYAHNGGRFDYHYMKPHFNSDDPIMVIGQRIARFRIGLAELRDSTNLLPVPLADFQKTKVDYSIMKAGERDKPHNRRIIELYLKSDCVNLYNFLREFFGRYGRNLTQASAAMKYWSVKYKKEPPRQTEANFKAMQPFYYGGRVQCFAHGYRETRFKVLDINSAYPYAMTFQHPFSTDRQADHSLPKRETDIGPTLIRLIAISKGALPLRDEDGALYFPDDERRGREYCVTGWEYLAGLETGTLKPVRVKEVLHFKEKVSFADYVAEFYDMRKVAKANGDRAADIFAKLFLNSLYGKFAANPANYQEYIITHFEREAEYQAAGWALNSQWNADRSLLTRPISEGKRRYYNIATAASITGFVRAYLWRAVQQCSGIIYCDTDSIAAADTGTLELGGNLGAWKHEMNSDIYAVAGKKTYAFHDADWYAGKVDEKGEPIPEWKIACKGVKLTAAEIVRVAKGGRVSYMPNIPTYSVHRAEPRFIPREIISTYKDISRFPLAKMQRAA